MNAKKNTRKIITKIKQIPRRYLIPAIVGLNLVVSYGVIFMLDKQVTFSYSQITCTRHFSLFPTTQKVVEGGEKYEIRPSKLLSIGQLHLASLSMCFVPKTTPEQGTHRVTMSPLGQTVARKTFIVSVKPPPVARADSFKLPIPISKPLKINLSEADRVFSYYLSVNNKETRCVPSSAATLCDMRKLALIQGTDYDLKLERKYGDESTKAVVERKITTLSATNIVGSSVQPGEIVYSSPSAIDMKFDKEIIDVSPRLTFIKDNKVTEIEQTSKIVGKDLNITLSQTLPRSTDVTLTLDKLEAKDGSSLLADPHTITFAMSGGPKVTGVNTPRVGVPLNAKATVTFDQLLSESQDISKSIIITGGAKLIGKQDNRIMIDLTGVPKCGDFSIKIANDVLSRHNIGNNSAWESSGRMVCHSVETIGYSTQGRAVNAYIFGSGTDSIVYTGAIHGNERSTRLLMERWKDELEANVRSIPQGKTVVVIPQLNPDGVATGSRVNTRNVDLNRNFSTSDWRKDITDVNNRPFAGGGGAEAMSEAETRTISGYIQRLRPSLVLSYHSIGGLVAANQAGNSAARASLYSQLSGYRNTTGQTSTTFEYAVSGTADDWYAEKLGVASVLVELGSHSYHQFPLNQKAMWAMINA